MQIRRKTLMADDSNIGGTDNKVEPVEPVVKHEPAFTQALNRLLVAVRTRHKGYQTSNVVVTREDLRMLINDWDRQSRLAKGLHDTLMATKDKGKTITEENHVRKDVAQVDGAEVQSASVLPNDDSGLNNPTTDQKG
jgi:hypothetical protein